MKQKAYLIKNKMTNESNGWRKGIHPAEKAWLLNKSTTPNKPKKAC